MLFGPGTGECKLKCNGCAVTALGCFLVIRPTGFMIPFPNSTARREGSTNSLRHRYTHSIHGALVWSRRTVRNPPHLKMTVRIQGAENLKWCGVSVIIDYETHELSEMSQPDDDLGQKPALSRDPFNGKSRATGFREV